MWNGMEYSANEMFWPVGQILGAYAMYASSCELSNML